jgi:hypothetical protein
MDARRFPTNGTYFWGDDAIFSKAARCSRKLAEPKSVSRVFSMSSAYAREGGRSDNNISQITVFLVIGLKKYHGFHG